MISINRLVKLVKKAKKAAYNAFATYRVTCLNDDGSVFSTHFAYTHSDAMEWQQAQMDDMLTKIESAWFDNVIYAAHGRYFSMKG